MLRLHGPYPGLVHLVARQMDKRMPPTRQVRTAEQEILHHHRIATRLFQRRHPLRTTTRYLRYENLHNKQSLNRHSLLAWILVSPRHVYTSSNPY
jgi:hypothetical protein